MFSIDPSLGHIEAGRDQIVAIIESVNQPHVAIPGKTPQAAKAFVIGVRNPSASFSIYLYLFLGGSREAVIWAYSHRQFALEAYREVETEALTFVESMGFMMENVNFRNLPKPAQDELLASMTVFAPLVGEVAAEEEAPGVDERGQKLARLLGAF